MSDLSEATWDRVQRAKEKGCEVVEPDPFTLLLDLDSEEALAQFRKYIMLVDELFQANYVEKWNSSGGEGHYHLRVVLHTELTPAQRLALQAALGSDPTREILGVRRTVLNIEFPSLLFKPNDAQVRRYSWDELSEI